MGSTDVTYFNVIPSFFNSLTVIFFILSLDNTRLFETYYISPTASNPLTPSWSQQYGAFEVCTSYSTITASVGSCYSQSAGQCDYNVFDPIAAKPMPFSISPCAGWNAYRAFAIMTILSSGLSAVILSYFGFARLSSPDETPLWYSMVACGFAFFAGISGVISMAILLGVFVSSGDTLMWGFNLMVAGWVLAIFAGLFNFILIMKEHVSNRRLKGERESIVATTAPAIVVSTAAVPPATAPSETPAAKDGATVAKIDNGTTASGLDPAHLGPLPTVPAHHKSHSKNLSANAPSLNATPSQTPGVIIHNGDDLDNEKEGVDSHDLELHPYEPPQRDEDKLSDDKV